MASGAEGVHQSSRIATPQLPRREIRKAGKAKQSFHIVQLTAQLAESQHKLRLSVQRQAAIVAACNAASAVCLRYNSGHEFVRTLIGSISLALHHLAPADASAGYNERSAGYSNVQPEIRSMAEIFG